MSDQTTSVASQMPPAPVVWLASDRHKPPEEGLALALSGGGTRAMMFHAGALLRLYELGLFPELRRISGVSGGSIAAGVLAREWSKLPAVEANVDRSAAFMSAVIEPLRVFARQRTDIFAWLRGTFTPGSSPVQRLAEVLDEHLYHGTMLADLPDDPPRFVFNSTNISTGVLWRFSKPYMADYRLGRVLGPNIRLATAVAASSAFPPFFSPLKLRVDPTSYGADDVADGSSGIPAHKLSRFRELPHLGDGGIYDNLALETVWKRYRDVLVSDGGGTLNDDPRPPTDLIVQTIRVMKTIDRQVRALRRSLLIRSYQEPSGGPGFGWRRGAYWGVRTSIADYKVADAANRGAGRNTHSPMADEGVDPAAARKLGLRRRGCRRPGALPRGRSADWISLPKGEGMTSERFLAVQAEIRQSPAPLWERWTIDEIDEEFARVLISRAGNASRLRDMAGQVATESSPASSSRRMSSVLRDEAMRGELNPRTEQWSEEALGYGHLTLLQTFVRSRGGKPGLPTNRPLREGDVFWVMVADWPGPVEPPADMSRADLESHIAALKEATADVWDVTAAARQAAKRSYHEVLRKANEEDQAHVEAEHG